MMEKPAKIEKENLKFYFTSNTTNTCTTCRALTAVDITGTEYVIAGRAGYLVPVSLLPNMWGFKRFTSKQECQRFIDELPEEIEIETPKTIRRFYGFSDVNLRGDV